MLDIQQYIRNGRVEREKIAMDIQKRVLTGADLRFLMKNTDIQAAFFGQAYEKKVPKEQWDAAYLELLTYAVVAEGFNEDYLLYLDEVADYVFKKKESSKIIKRIIIGSIIIIIAVIAGVLVVLTNRG